jgi:hypothetical protein
VRKKQVVRSGPDVLLPPIMEPRSRKANAGNGGGTGTTDGCPPPAATGPDDPKCRAVRAREPDWEAAVAGGRLPAIGLRTSTLRAVRRLMPGFVTRVGATGSSLELVLLE